MSVSGETTAGAPALTVTVPNAQASQRDLAAGMAVDRDKTVSDGGVELTFDHVLSRIGFTAKLKEQYSGCNGEGHFPEGEIQTRRRGE